MTNPLHTIFPLAAAVAFCTQHAHAQDCPPAHSGRLTVTTGAPFSGNPTCATHWDDDNRPETPSRLVVAGSGSPPYVWLADQWSERLWRGFNGTSGVTFRAIASWDFDGPGPIPEYLVACGDFGFSLSSNSGAAYYDGYSWIELKAPGGFAMSHSYPWDMVVWQPPGADSASKILVMGGEFNRNLEPQNVYANNIVTWDTTMFGFCDAGLNGKVESLAVWESYPGSPDSVVVAVGLFTASGAIPLNQIAMWNGQQWSQPGDGLPGYSGDLGWGKKVGLFDPDGDGPGRPNIVVAYPLNERIAVAEYDGTTWKSYPSLAPGGVWQISTWQPTPESTPKLLVNGSWGVNAPPGLLFEPESNSWVPLIPETDALAKGRNLTAILPLSSGPARPPGDPWILCGWNTSTPLGLDTSNLASFDGAAVSLFPTGFTYSSQTVPKVTSLANWDPDGDGPANPELIAAGLVAYSGTERFGNIAGWNGKSWTAMGASGISGTVSGLTTWCPAPGLPRHLVAGGSPNMVGASSTQLGNLAFMSPTTAAWAPLGSGLNGNVLALASWTPPGSNSELLIAGGTFNSAGLTSLSQIGAWNGTRWTPLGPPSAPGMNGTVNAIIRFDPDGPGSLPEYLVAAGAFTSAGGTPASRIALWNGATWQPFGAGMNGAVNSLLAWDHDNDGATAARLVAGGTFTQADAKPMTGLAVWDGTTWYSLGDFAGGKVSSLISWDTDGSGPATPRLVAGGAFTSVNTDTALRYLVAWDGSAWRLASDSQPAFVVEALQHFDVDGPGPLEPDLVAGASPTTGGRAAFYLAVQQPPIITAQPQSTCPGSESTLRVEAIGNQTLYYMWYRDGIALTEGMQSDGSIASGVYQPELRLSGLDPGETHDYAVRVFSGCKSVLSWLATVNMQGCCPGDLNGDRAVDDADFALFIPQYDIAVCPESTLPPGCTADLNGDKFVDDADFQIFVIAYNTLICPSDALGKGGAR